MKKTKSPENTNLITTNISAEPGGQIHIETLQLADTINNVTQNIIVNSTPANELPVVWGSIPLENFQFFEPATMRKINNGFADTAFKKHLIITGLGGIGKTELAKHYFYHPVKTYTSKIWITADSRERLEFEYQLLAKELNLINDNDTADLIKRKIHAFLAKYPGWLLVLDNADDVSAIEDLLPPQGGDVLVTSRQPHWRGEVIHVAILEENEAVHLYKKLNNDQDADEIILKETIQELGFLPLAIAQAAAYIKHAPNVTIKEYLDLFKKYRSKFLSTNKLSEKKEDQDRLTLSTTWNLSLEAIEQKYNKSDEERSYARTILTVCAFLNYSSIPTVLLQKYLEYIYLQTPSVLVLNSALDELNSYSLIKIDKKSISIHNLMHDVIRTQTTKNQQKTCVNHLIASLDQVFDYQKYNVNSVEKVKTQKENVVYDQLIFHINSLFAEEGLAAQRPLESHSVLLKLIQYLMDVKSNYKLAQSLLSHLIKLHQDTKDRQTIVTQLELMREKACLLMMSGNVPQANKEFEEAIKICTSNDGIPEYLTDTLYCQLANTSYMLGQYKKAEVNYYLILEKHQSINIKEQLNLNVAAAWCGLGNVRLAANQRNEAQIAYKKSLEIYFNIGLGEAHKNIANIYHNLALANERDNNHNSTMQYYKKAEEIYHQFYFNDRHIDMATCAYDMARFLYSQQKYADALIKIQTALKIYNNIYGVMGHIDMVTLVFYMGFIMCRQNNRAHGLLKYQRAFEVYDTTYKSTEENTFTHLVRYAKEYYSKGEFEKSEECYLLLMQLRYPILKQKGARIVPFTKTEEDHYRGISSTQLNLIAACYQGDLNQVMPLVTLTSDINEITQEGVTPLYAAAEQGHLNVVKYLVMVGYANINHGKNPIQAASEHDHFQIVDWLLSFKLKSKNNDLNQRVWDYGMPSMVNGSAALSNIKKVIKKLIEGFFGDDAEIQKQASEILIGFDEKILSGLCYLKDTSGYTFLRHDAYEELMLTLCTIDIDVVFSLFKNVVGDDWNTRSYDREDKEAKELLKTIGVSDAFLATLNYRNSSTSDMKQYVDNTMKQSFIFKEDNAKSAQSTENKQYYFPAFNNMRGFSNNKDIQKTKKSISIIDEFKGVLNEISEIVISYNKNQTRLHDLIKYFSSENALVRFVAKNTVIFLNLLENVEIVTALISTLSNRNWRIRRDNAQLLAFSTLANSKYSSQLDNILQDEMPQVQQVRAISLINQQPDNNRVLLMLIDHLSNADWKVRYGAVKALAKISPSNNLIMEHLVRCIDDLDEDVQSLAIEYVKEISKKHYKTIINFISKHFFKPPKNQAPESVIALLNQLCLNAEQDKETGLLLIKCLTNSNKYYNYYEDSNKSFVTLCKFYKNNKALLDFFLEDFNWASLDVLNYAVKVFPEFKDILFNKTIADLKYFTSVAGNLYNLEKYLKIFPEYREAALSCFKNNIISTVEVRPKYMGDLKKMVEYFPEFKSKMLSAITHDREYFLSLVNSELDLIDLVKCFPENEDLFFAWTVDCPGWPLPLTHYFSSMLERITNAFPQKTDLLYNRIINDEHMIASYINSIYDLVSLVIPPFITEVKNRVLNYC